MPDIIIGKPTTAPARSSYRHGDLHRALLEAGIQLAREGGPAAVVLREVTRRVGVVPNAAYRHFASRRDLLQAVRSAALAQLALAMEVELAGLPSSKRRADTARATLRAVGTGYLRFARSEPGLFRTAFSISDDLQGETMPAAPEPGAQAVTDPAKAGNTGLDPFQLLSNALDQLVEAQVLPAERRMAAEYLAWSAVHGLAMLVIDGPLRSLSPAQFEVVGQRLLDMVEKGL